MKLHVQEAQGVALLALGGRFDSYAAPEVGARLEQIIVTHPRVVVDLAAVDFVDSMALATLVQALKRCRDRGGDLYLCGMRQPVALVFRLTRLDKAFQLYDDREEALSALAAAYREVG